MAQPITSIAATLNERNKRYGTFLGNATVTQRLQDVIGEELLLRQKLLAPDQIEALEMICHKISRIVNGDPDYVDNWVDIAGYAQLVVFRLEGNPQ